MNKFQDVKNQIEELKRKIAQMQGENVDADTDTDDISNAFADTVNDEVVETPAEDTAVEEAPAVEEGGEEKEANEVTYEFPLLDALYEFAANTRPTVDPSFLKKVGFDESEIETILEENEE